MHEIGSASACGSLVWSHRYTDEIILDIRVGRWRRSIRLHYETWRWLDGKLGPRIFSSDCTGHFVLPSIACCSQVNNILFCLFFLELREFVCLLKIFYVVDRDLKPENVLFFEKLGVVKLTDFGFSNKFCPGQKLATSCGSLAYSAPEILLGDSYDAPAVGE